MTRTADDAPVVIGLGELLWDIFPDGKRTGGAPANVAFQAMQLGCQGIVLSRVGSDALGDELIAELRGKGMNCDWIQRDPEHPTGTVTVSLDAGGHPSYVIHENVAWDFLSKDNVPPVHELAGRAQAICFGSLAQRQEDSRRTIQSLLTAAPRHCLKVFDVNLRQHYFSADVIENSLQRANALKLNDEEVPVVAKLLGLATEEREFATAVIERFDLRFACITRGANGCLLATSASVHAEPGVAVKVADTVGAGDAFTAGLIYATLREWPIHAASRFANRVGALVASRSGGMPELRQEFVRLIAEFK